MAFENPEENKPHRSDPDTGQRAQVSQAQRVESNQSSSRRKIVDRRDPDNQPSGVPQERRMEGERRSRAGSLPAKASAQGSLLEERIQQHRKKKLLAGCEPAMGMNYDCLAMDDYPSNEVVASAKQERDYWLAIGVTTGSIFLFGFVGLVPAVMAGIACGISVLSFLLAHGPVRKRFFDSPSYAALLQERKAIEFKALNHIQFLEGRDGLAWRCQKMHKYNNNLDRKLFNGMMLFSRQGQMMEVIRNRKQIRLYLLFMIESQKAYKRLQKDYLENHFKYLEQGVDDTLSGAELNRAEVDYEEPPEPTHQAKHSR